MEGKYWSCSWCGVEVRDTFPDDWRRLVVFHDRKPKAEGVWHGCGECFELLVPKGESDGNDQLQGV
jgi:hypothetical protein